MIVPRPRLLLWVGAAGLPLVAALSAPSPAAPAAAAILAALLVAILVDATLAPGRIAGLDIGLPDDLRLLCGRPGELALRLRRPALGPRTIRLGLHFPGAIETREREREVVLPAGGGEALLAWPCTGRRRGVFQVGPCRVEGASPLGFWAARRTIPATATVRVYPDLMAEGRAAASIFLRRGLAGVRASRQVGKGREFEKLREYVAGDGLEDVHWKAAAKRGRPVTKVFQLERTQEVYALVDASRLAARQRGDSQGPAVERFVSAALLLAAAAERQGDQFGLIAYSDTIRRFVRAGRGRAHFVACREALCTLVARVVTPDFEEVAAFVRRRLRRRALLVTLTDLDDPVLAESYQRACRLMARRHLVVTCMPRPPEARPLFTGADVAGIDTLYRRLAGHLVWHDLVELGRGLQRLGVGLFLMDSATIPAAAVGKYVEVKRRQLL